MPTILTVCARTYRERESERDHLFLAVEQPDVVKRVDVGAEAPMDSKHRVIDDC